MTQYVVTYRNRLRYSLNGKSPSYSTRYEYFKTLKSAKKLQKEVNDGMYDGRNEACIHWRDKDQTFHHIDENGVISQSTLMKR